MTKKILAVLLSIMLLLSGFGNTVFAAEKISAKLLEFKGDVQVIRAGGEKPFKAFVNMRLAEGDRIITGSDGSAKIEMDQSTVITLAENTKIYLSELRGSDGAKQSSINLQSGGVGTSVKEKLTENSRLQIKTPTAVMGVRGTEFFTQYYNGNVDVRVVDGVVEIEISVNEEDGRIAFEGEGTVGYRFQISALQQAIFASGDTLEDASDSIGALELDGLPIPFLEQIQEINAQNPGLIPADILDTIQTAIENAVKKLQEAMGREDLAPDELASVLEREISGNIQEATPGTIPPTAQDPWQDDDYWWPDSGSTEPVYHTVTLSGGGLSLTPEASNNGFEENTQITVTILPERGKQIKAFTVNGSDQKANITQNSTYSFAITRNTNISVEYESIPQLPDVEYEIYYDGESVADGEKITYTLFDEGYNFFSLDLSSWVEGISYEIEVNDETIIKQEECLETTGGDFVPFAMETPKETICFQALRPGETEVTIIGSAAEYNAVTKTITVAVVAKVSFDVVYNNDYGLVPNVINYDLKDGEIIDLRLQTTIFEGDFSYEVIIDNEEIAEEIKDEQDPFHLRIGLLNTGETNVEIVGYVGSTTIGARSFRLSISDTRESESGIYIMTSPLDEDGIIELDIEADFALTAQAVGSDFEKLEVIIKSEEEGERLYIFELLPAENPLDEEEDGWLLEEGIHVTYAGPYTWAITFIGDGWALASMVNAGDIEVEFLAHIVGEEDPISLTADYTLIRHVDFSISYQIQYYDEFESIDNYLFFDTNGGRSERFNLFMYYQYGEEPYWNYEVSSSDEGVAIIRNSDFTNIRVIDGLNPGVTEIEITGFAYGFNSVTKTFILEVVQLIDIEPESDYYSLSYLNTDTFNISLKANELGLNMIGVKLLLFEEDDYEYIPREVLAFSLLPDSTDPCIVVAGYGAPEDFSVEFDEVNKKWNIDFGSGLIAQILDSELVALDLLLYINEGEQIVENYYDFRVVN